MTMTEDDILTAVRRGINTRHRLILAFFKHSEDDVRHLVATMIYRGLLKTKGKLLEVV